MSVEKTIKNQAKEFLKEDITEALNCRICNSRNIEDLNHTKNYFLSSLSLNVKIKYAVCTKCNFIFQKNYLGDRFFNLYYKNSPMLREPNSTKYEINQYKLQTDFLKKNINLNKITSLEIGAHTGNFLQYLHQNYKNECYYDEISEEAVKILKKNKYLNPYDYSLNSKKVDLCILRHVLEHIYDLTNFILNIRSSINKTGHLFIEVPDWSHLDKNTDPFLFEHINQFNTVGLISLFRKYGFELEALEKSINKYDPTTPNRVSRLIFSKTEIPIKSKKILKYFNVYSDLHHELWKKKLSIFLSKQEINKSIAFTPASHLTSEFIQEYDCSKLNVIGLFDNDKKKHNQKILGYQVYNTNELYNYNPDIIIVLSMGYENEIIDHLDKMNISSQIVGIAEEFN
jgi:2-polyprenyl-3-methyl-5-hydroxy-6-metoxy-1,4-benzoquinol methylase